MNYTKDDITAIILAGGEGKRFGGINKGLLELDGETFVTLLLTSLANQTHTQIISVNNDLSKYEFFNRQLIKDSSKGFQGPLSGIISCKDYIKTALVMTVPCDLPLIPTVLVQRLQEAYNSSTSKLCVAHDGERMQNLLLLFDHTLLEDMTTYFLSGKRSAYGWLSRHAPHIVDFSDCSSQFTNINNEEDLKSLNKMMLNQK